ncbi:hypothetical protein CHLNCDRAFT_26827 [Chlorella variabilis]|uniref:BPL/LPL catalytic domain-containing protein n=1 Tax=Chlorella variabilis TaxID=554065 RepID=E1ZNW4_CHLVA|nr:hypothetical protein CHLNCDRAFT_26827 [Chlorella variabilis]EFN52509.1 hypothetical protein CHLNCDRAFT_26827 [Chlorella variabilis]|eukprot:XP_005844611.1 hypothetical protein CHLNCDRAFT_26827 [Chlorella variabilis]
MCGAYQEHPATLFPPQAGPLVAQRGSADVPEQHCTLAYPSPAAGSSCQPAGGTFAAQRYMAALDTRLLGRLLLTAAATASTQVVVQENVAKLPDGLVFVADKQYGGKGRGGNRWESPDGCLMFSAATRLAIPGQRLPFVQYVVSLAVVHAGGAIDVRIKWPNDVYAGGLKLGGILCHSSYRDSLFHIILGVGLNLSNRQPTTCQQQHQQALEPVSREVLLAGILSRLEPMLAQLAAEGFAPFEAEYCRHWLHSGQRVQLEEGGQLTPVTIRGLSPSGYLLATDAGGERYELHPDGNSLDFFRGLVRKKLPQ